MKRAKSEVRSQRIATNDIVAVLAVVWRTLNGYVRGFVESSELEMSVTFGTCSLPLSSDTHEAHSPILDSNTGQR
jgi:hypothetical protein